MDKQEVEVVMAEVALLGGRAKPIYQLQKIIIYECVPFTLAQAKSIKKVHFMGLSELPDIVGEFVHLTHLSITNGTIRSLPKSIGNLKNLRSLDVSKNKLTSLPESIGNLKNLRSLYINSNNLSEVPESISNLTRLNDLAIYGNNLDKLPECIKALKPRTWVY